MSEIVATIALLGIGYLISNKKTNAVRHIKYTNNSNPNTLKQ